MKRKHMVRAAVVVLACAALTGAALAPEHRGQPDLPELSQ